MRERLPPIVANQAQTFLRLWHSLAAFVGTDRAWPARLERALRADRRFGSRDRRLYRELSYTAVRYLPWVQPALAAEERSGDALTAIVWLAADIPALHAVKAAWLDRWPAPAVTLTARAATLRERLPALVEVGASLLPTWIEEECPEARASPLYDCLQQRAPLWLRLQTDDVESVAAEFSSLGWTWDEAARPNRAGPGGPVAPSADSPPDPAWRLHGEGDVTRTEAYARGAVEIQDLGSQQVLAEVTSAAGESWLDACAGAGGKTLQLARRVGLRGRVTAYDVRPAALEELRLRASRAGLGQVCTRATPPTELFDGVLVDAPCSGSGTWRRAPHLKWSISRENIAEAAQLQIHLLRTWSERVRPGGRLIYATCSLCRSENEAVAAAFAREHLDFTLESQRRILPHQSDTDGFFVAHFRRV